MNKIDELIQQYCPEGVEYVKLGDCCNILDSQRKPVAKGARSNGIYPYYGANGIQDYVSDYIFDGTYVLVGEDGSVITKNGNPVINWATGKIWVNNHAHILGENDKAILRYLFFILQTLDITPLIHGNIPKLTKGDLKDLEIPLPPLPVQEAIVNILDRFTVYAAELQAELQARQQQYNYYRDTLLSFESRDDVQWKKLGEVASIKTGRRFVRTDIRESGVPCFHYGDIYTYYGLTATKTKGYLDTELASKLRFAQPNDVVVVCAGENDMDIGVGVAWLGDEPAVIHDACCILHHEQNPRYISHFLRTHNYHLQMKRYVKNGKISSLPASGLAEALIPIPSLEEQEKIANILDRFDHLVNDLSQGLPAEIEARQQQYEYYRDQLLTFKRKEA